MAGNVNEITDSNFTETVGGTDGLYLLDFWATWCAPCRAIAPTVQALADEMGDVVKVGKVDIDANQQTAFKFGVRSIPTLILFKGGQPVGQLVGANHTKASLADWVREHQ
jgi:thioredoxin 1